MVKIVVLDDYQGVALSSADWSVLPQGTEITVLSHHLAGKQELVRQVGEFEVISAMRERTVFSADTLKQLPKLKLLVTTGMRNASIDLDAATELGILVCGTGGSAQATSELTWGLILSLLRHIPEENVSIRKGEWQKTIGNGLEGKTLGVLGLGRLGSQVAMVGQAFGMSVIAWSQNLTEERAFEFNAELVTKDMLFAGSDVVTIHLQLSDRTRGLVGERELALMKSSAYLINTSRGPIVDESALITALEEGWIRGAGLDVYDEEPLADTHPLSALRNTILTPHLGYVTEEGYRVFYSQTVEDIQTYLAGGNPLRLLNPAVLGRERSMKA